MWARRPSADSGRTGQDDALGGFDRPGVDGEGFGPGTVEQDVDLPYESSTSTDRLADLYPYRSCLDGVDLQRGSPRTLFSLNVDLVPQPAAGRAKRFDLSWTEGNRNSRPFGTPDS